LKITAYFSDGKVRIIAYIVEKMYQGKCGVKKSYFIPLVRFA